MIKFKIIWIIQVKKNYLNINMSQKWIVLKIYLILIKNNKYKDINYIEENVYIKNF